MRRLDRTQVTHQLCGGLGHVGHLAESFCVSQAMIGLIGCGEPGEFVGISIPIEITAIYNNASYGSGMPIHVFGGGVGNDVSSPFKWTAVDWSGKRVVYNQRYTMFMSHAGKFLNVEHIDAWVRNGFSKQRFGVRLESFVQFFFGSIGVDKCTIDA